MRSLPVRGAWIEIIFGDLQAFAMEKSLPVRGAWIEIMAAHPSVSMFAVAPRAGSVD